MDEFTTTRGLPPHMAQLEALVPTVILNKWGIWPSAAPLVAPTYRLTVLQIPIAVDVVIIPAS